MSTTATKTREPKVINIRGLTVSGLFSAVAFILMFLDTAVPFMPSFIKLDISELPALICSFCFGPAYGVAVCLVKNLIHLTITTTGGVGELSNFILGTAFVAPAGFIYTRKKSKKNALIGSIVGAICMAVVCFPSNYFIVYPFYYNFMPEEAIVAAYQAIIPSVKSIAQCLLVFNVPFTFVKGIISVVITVFIYKPLSPILKGNY